MPCDFLLASRSMRSFYRTLARPTYYLPTYLVGIVGGIVDIRKDRVEVKEDEYERLSTLVGTVEPRSVCCSSSLPSRRSGSSRPYKVTR